MCSLTTCEKYQVVKSLEIRPQLTNQYLPLQLGLRTLANLTDVDTFKGSGELGNESYLELNI